MRYRIAIIDDIEEDIRLVKDAVNSACSEMDSTAEITWFLSTRSAIDAAKIHQLIADIVFVDVMMPDIKGTGLIPELRNLLPDNSLFVLMSTNHGYVQEGYSVEAFDFLCKPPSVKQIKKLLLRAKQKLQAMTEGSYTFRADRMDYRIPYSDILYFSVERNYVSLTTVDKTYIFKSSLKEIAASLPKCFVQTSRDTLVNLTNVSAISRTAATFGMYGKKAKITEQYLDDVQTAFITLN